MTFSGHQLSSILTASGRQQAELMEQAAAVTRERFGNRVFVRGVVEVSNYCRENCVYCGMRRDNRSLHRHRAEADQLIDLLLHHRPESITDINIQSGEDPVAVRDVVLPLLKALSRETDLGLSVCLGTLNDGLYQELMDAGASIYIMKFEVANSGEYIRYQSPGNQPERLEHIRKLSRQGWRISSGFIAGLPTQSQQHLEENIQLAGSLPLAGCSVSPFIPGDETPLSSEPMPPIEVTLNSMLALRLMRPDWVIPSVSALNLTQPGEGYQRGLAAGANLVTINLTPEGMREDYLLYKRKRFIMNEERILQAIKSSGLEPSATGLARYYRDEYDVQAEPGWAVSSSAA